MADTPLPKYGTNAAGDDVNLLSTNASPNGEAQQNSINKLLASFAGIAHVISKADTPSGSNESDAHLVGASASGDFAGMTEDNIAVLIDGAWHEIAPDDGFAIIREDLNNSVHLYDGSNWLEAPASTADNITASATQTQGQQPLTARYNRVTVVGTNGDVVTLPAAAPGLMVVVFNDDQSGSNSMDVFPASGDEINALGVDTALSVAAAASVAFYAISATNWAAVS